jgi:hypothetical protein
MLVALLTILLLGGGSNLLIGDIQSVEEQVKLVMEKNDARKSALGTLDEMAKMAKKRDKMLGKMRKKVKKLVADHDSSSEDADKLWSELTSERTEFHADMIKLRFEFKSQLSREAWGEIFTPS